MQKDFRLQIRQVLEALKLNFKNELNQSDSKTIVEKLLKRKFIIEPDKLYLGGSYKPNEIVYLGKTNNAGFLSGDSYKLASLMLDFGVGFAYLDNIFCINEETSLYNFISKNFLKNETEKDHLKLRIKLLREQPPDPNKITSHLTKKLKLNDLEMLSEYMMMVVLADGRICEKEDEGLRLVFKDLGLTNAYIEKLYKKFKVCKITKINSNTITTMPAKKDNQVYFSDIKIKNVKNENTVPVNINSANLKNNEIEAIIDDQLKNQNCKEIISKVQNTAEETHTILKKSKEDRLHAQNDLNKEIHLEGNGACEISRVEVDTKRVHAILSKVFENGEPSFENTSTNDLPTKLEEAHKMLVEYIIKFDTIEKKLLEEKARNLKLMVHAAIIHINEWSDEKYSDQLLFDDEEDNTYDINSNIVSLILQNGFRSN